MTEKRKSIFISYAHKDGMEFTRRLALSLEMYFDVFWDRRLQAGNFPHQLDEEIETRDYLIFVMTHYSIVSEWCLHEFAHAKSCGKKIVLARIYQEDGANDPKMIKKYSYGDFTTHFDEGFKAITALILGVPRSSWEYLGNLPEAELIQSLSEGILPGLIVNEFAEWLILEVLYRYVEILAKSHYRSFTASYAQPRTFQGVFRILQTHISEAARTANDIIVVTAAKDAKAIVTTYLDATYALREDNHKAFGQHCAKLIDEIKAYRKLNAIGDNKVTDYQGLEHFSEFNMGEKLTELIQIYARRSRYLY